LRASPPRAATRGADGLLGGYRLLGQIAVGEFCSLHRARSVHPVGAPGDVVVKRLLRAHQHSQGRARLLREARVGLGLRAPNLVRVLEIHDEPELFVVMEHVAGATLRALLNRAHEVDAMRYIVPIFVDVLHGLSVLHNWKDEQGAPGFLVHQAPSTRHMLVGLDGVTRLIDLSNVHGRLLGTPADADNRSVRCAKAPEQVAAGAVIDPRCDIFIVGTALLAALACARDARAASLGESHVRAQLGPLQALCEQACAPARAARFWSAEEMAYALEKTAREADLCATPQAIGAYVRRVLALPSAPLPRPPARACVPPPPPVHAMKHTIDYSALPRAQTAPRARAEPASQPPLRAAPPSQPPLLAGPPGADARLPEPPVRPEARTSSSAIPGPARASSLPAPGPVTMELVLPTTTRQRVAGFGFVAATLAASVLIVGLRDTTAGSSVAAARAPVPAAVVEPSRAPPAVREPEALRPIVTSLAWLPEAPPVRAIAASTSTRAAAPNAQPAQAKAAAPVLLSPPLRPVRRQAGLSVHDFAEPLPAALTRGLPANPYE